MSCEEAFENLLKTFLSLGGSLEGCKGEGVPPLLFSENWKISALIFGEKNAFMKVPKLNETFPALKNFYLHACLIKKKWEYREKCGEVLFGGKMGGDCENPVGLSMYDAPMETVEYIWVNIMCMLDWISSHNCRNTLPLHIVDQLV